MSNSAIPEGYDLFGELRKARRFLEMTGQDEKALSVVIAATRIVELENGEEESPIT